MSERKFLAALGSIALFVSGCAGLPTSGPPHQFALDVPVREPLGQYSSGPQTGTSPEQLVADFLRACAAGAFDDYSTARAYLLPDLAGEWDPSAEVRIFPTDSTPKTEQVLFDDTAHVALSVPLMATLDEQGTLSQLPSVTETRTAFELARDDEGEWRISELQDGLVLSQSSFQAAFAQYNVYFAASDGAALVSDPRWVPRLRAASHLTQKVLGGPQGSLQPAVVGNIASGLTLPTGAVEVIDRTALVRLDGQAPADATLRSLLVWELTATLRQVPNVSQVSVSVGQVEIDVDIPEPPDYVFDRVVALDTSGLVVGPVSAPSLMLSTDQLGVSPRFPSVGPLRSSPFAWVSDEGIGELASSKVRFHPLDAPTEPSIDRFANVWTSSGSTLLRIDTSGSVQELDPGLGGLEVTRVCVAPDGARIALLTRDGGVWVATLEASDGAIAISAPTPELRAGPDVVDISWAGTTTLMALVGAQDPALKILPLGGFSRSWSAPEGGRWLSGASGSLGAIVQLADQSAFQRSGAAWMPLGDQLLYISTPG